VSRYFCPDHPDIVIHDDDPRSDHHQPQALKPGPKRVTCPLDGRSYPLPHCRRESEERN
jgi:hypothetical protein